jgi:hypothetical protein
MHQTLVCVHSTATTSRIVRQWRTSKLDFLSDVMVEYIWT